MIELRNITKTFKGQVSPVLDNINLSINKGDFCIIIGPNGSGKSSLTKIISGEYIPDAGHLNLKGKISQVNQDISKGTVAEMTLLENIALSQIKKNGASFLFYNRYKQYAINKVKELNLGLEKYLDTPMSNLSGGQRQVIATLMAINSGSDVLMLDEHTSALDPNSQNVLMSYTNQEIKKQDITTIMITHKMDDAIKYGNRLILINKGKIVMDLSLKEKENLTIDTLLEIFHNYEDEILIGKN